MFQSQQILQERYHLKHLLSKQSSKQTWLGLDQTSHEEVVVKLLVCNTDVQWDHLKLFEREAQVLKQLDHPHIPKYRDFFSVSDSNLWLGLVYKFIPGTSLKSLLVQGRKFLESDVQQIATSVLQILTYLHSLSPPVLHRDIKPSNLIYGDDQQVYLVDFGAVQDKTPVEGGTFTVVGTYGYTPMEQFGGQAVPASDLYALGAALIHLVTGTSPAELPQRQMRIQFADRISLSPDFVRWLQTMTEPAVEDRFRTAQQALEALSNPFTFSSEQTALASIPQLRPPANTRIRVYKTENQLDIQIPPQDINVNTLLRSLMSNRVWPLLVLTFIFLLLNAINGDIIAPVLLFWIGGLIWIGYSAIARFSSRSRIYFDLSYFWLESRGWWHLSGKRKIGETSGIVCVTPHLKRQDSQINIQAVEKVYTFGAKLLLPSECAWLAQEIQHWLDSIGISLQPDIGESNRLREHQVNSAQGYLDRGKYNLEACNYQDAIEDFNQAIQLRPDFHEVYSHRGRARCYLGDTQGAIEDFTRSVEFYPSDANHYNLGVAQHIEGLNYEAIDSFTKATEDLRIKSFAYYLRGNARYDIGDRQGAFEDFSQAASYESNVDEQPYFQNDEHAYYGRGLARYRLGNREGAIADLENAAGICLQRRSMALYQKIMQILQELYT